MKKIVLALTFFPFFSIAQDCSIKKETDQFTRESKLSTGFIKLQLSAVSIDADKKEFDFFFNIEGADKCFDDQSTLVVMFEGSKQRNTYRNTGSMNCEGLFHFTVRNGPETPFVVKRFATIKVAQLIFTTNNSKKPTTITLTPAQQEALMKAAGCMATAAAELTR